MTARRARRLSKRQALVLRELSRTPGIPVHWTLLADAIGIGRGRNGRPIVGNVVQGVRAKFGQDVVVGVQATRQRGYYLPVDWEKR